MDLRLPKALTGCLPFTQGELKVLTGLPWIHIDTVTYNIHVITVEHIMQWTD